MYLLVFLYNTWRIWVCHYQLHHVYLWSFHYLQIEKVFDLQMIELTLMSKQVHICSLFFLPSCLILLLCLFLLDWLFVPISKFEWTLRKLPLSSHQIAGNLKLNFLCPFDSCQCHCYPLPVYLHLHFIYLPFHHPSLLVT